MQHSFGIPSNVCSVLSPWKNIFLLRVYPRCSNQHQGLPQTSQNEVFKSWTLRQGLTADCLRTASEGRPDEAVSSWRTQREDGAHVQLNSRVGAKDGSVGKFLREGGELGFSSVDTLNCDWMG